MKRSGAIHPSLIIGVLTNTLAMMGTTVSRVDEDGKEEKFSPAELRATGDRHMAEYVFDMAKEAGLTRRPKKRRA